VRQSHHGGVIPAGESMLHTLSDRALFVLALLFAGIFAAAIDLVLVVLNGM
jgi:hypothetical protein